MKTLINSVLSAGLLFTLNASFAQTAPAGGTNSAPTNSAQPLNASGNPADKTVINTPKGSSSTSGSTSAASSSTSSKSTTDKNGEIQKSKQTTKDSRNAAHSSDTDSKNSKQKSGSKSSTNGSTGVDPEKLSNTSLKGE